MASSRRKQPPSPPSSSASATITVLAGVNGAGKSSVGGAALRAAGGEFYNPDETAHRIRSHSGTLTTTEANAAAWREGRRRLETAIRDGTHFNFETTLGGNTITRILLEAAQSGARLRIWFVGLNSVELHLQRVAERVGKGGHNIPEAAIRSRWESSRVNLVKLIPHVTDLVVFDNSTHHDPHKGETPSPRMLLQIVDRQLMHPQPEDATRTPPWAKPIIMAALKHFRR